MTTERDIALGVSVDATGARAGLNEISREAGTMAAAVARSSQQADAAAAGIGRGATTSSRNVESAQRNLIGSIQRTTAAMEAGSRTGAAYYEILARQRGVDPAVLQPYLAQLRAVEAAQARANTQVAGASAPLRQVGVSAAQTAAAQRNLIGSIQRTTAAMEAGSRTGAAYYEILARQRGVDPAVLQPYLAQLRAVEAAQARANTQVAGASAPLRQVGVSAAQTAAALRGVPAQVTDIVTSLQGGQAPLTVLLQQGGQLKDMFGGIGPAARALGGYVLGLVNPFTVAAAAAAGLAYAHHVGAAEAKAYALALNTTNNASGETVDRMAESARRIGQIAGDQSQAAAAIASLASTGRVPAENMERFAQVAVRAQRDIGRSVEDTVNDFAALGKAPLSALEQINDKYHFITAAAYAQVKALVDQGRAAEAANVAQQAYADGIDKQRQKVLDSLTDWERGWIRIKKATSGAIDAVLDIGRGATAFEKMNSLLQARDTIESNMARARELRDTRAVASYQKQLDQNTAQINAERAKGDAAKAAAKAEEDAVKRGEAKIKWDKEGDKYLTRAAQLERDVTKARNEGAAAGESQAAIDKRIADVRKSYADIFNDGIESNIEALKRRAAIEDVLTRRTIDRIAAAKASGGIREEDAIKQTADAEDAAFARRRKALEAEMGLLKGKQNSLKDQAAKQGEIDVLDQERISARIKATAELFALEQTRTRAGLSAYADSIDQATASGEQMRQQVRDQRDYNEEIGKTAEEILNLRAARAEELAVRKDADADIAEGLDLTGERARKIREEAAAIRERSTAEREGFAKQRDPWVQLSLSAKQYGDDAANVGKNVGDALTNAFRGAEDAFATFVTTGKLGFGDLARSILADFARMQAKQGLASLFSMAAGAAGNFIGGNWLGDFGPSLAGARASGGPVTGGQSYLVGEKGPEVFTPSSSGRIIANHALGGVGGDINISMQTNVSSGNADSQASASAPDARAMAEALNDKFKSFLVKETRQGGIIWNYQQGRA